MNGHSLLLLDLAMGNETSGIAVGVGAFKDPGVLYTTDGQNWQASTDLALLTAQDAVALSPTTYAFVGGLTTKENGVALSTDGGKSWQNHPWKGINLPSKDTAARYGAFPSEKVWYVSGGSFPNNNSAYHLTSRLSVEGFKLKARNVFPVAKSSQQDNGYSAVLTKTTDGGQTWAVQFSDLGSFYFNDIDCTDENTCFAVGEGFSDGTKPGTRIYKTTDGGKTWTQVYFNSQNGASLMRVHALSQTDIWAIGGIVAGGLNMVATFFHTTDGGQNWTLDSQDKGIGDVLGVSFVNTQLGFATGLTETDRSTILKYTP